MKKVITYGTFDVFHYGHFNLLERASALGNHLTVGVSSDNFNSIKDKSSYLNFSHRKRIVESFRFVDSVIEEKSWDQKINDIITLKIDIFVIGNDWSSKFDFLKEYCEVIYLPRTKDISSTKTRKLLDEHKD
jgi:glycerol-3-phosphate cytidylyltransferase|tara:strand:+ start:335 stop:730 length:396 start_codon:yes stop_codon:yes gene_type:complete